MSTALKWLMEIILAPLFSILQKKISDWVKGRAAKKRTDKEAQSAKEKMDKAKTAKEVDDAADSTLDGI